MSCLLDFDIRDTQFAGGAPLNGVDDDQPAFQAAIDYCATLGGLYTGGAAKLRVPRGIVRLEDSLDVTAANNVLIEGDGRGATTLQGINNVPVVKSTNVIGGSLNGFGIRDLTIIGPGSSNANAHGIDLGANFDCEIDVRVWGCRRAVALANSWQTRLIELRIGGQNSLACYDGLYLKDGQSSVVENAVEIQGGQVRADHYGIRGESVSGSKVFGLEVLDCGSIGVYIGDSPSGKDTKWFTWVGGLIDTCPQLLKVSKGSAAIAELMHFSGMWMGYAYASNGKAFDINGMKDCTFAADIITNVQYAANIQNCERVAFRADVIKDYDRGLTTSPAVVMNGSDDCSIHGGAWTKAAGSPSTVAVVEQNGAGGNTYRIDKASGSVSMLAGGGSVLK